MNVRKDARSYWNTHVFLLSLCILEKISLISFLKELIPFVPGE